MAGNLGPTRVRLAQLVRAAEEALRRFPMLHWKNRTALLLISVASVVAALGGCLFRGYGFYW
jgi:hypothetical protein